jgi:anthranilate synthase component 2
MGVRVKGLPVAGVQFHPESILTPEGKSLLKNALEGGCVRA